MTVSALTYIGFNLNLQLLTKVAVVSKSSSLKKRKKTFAKVFMLLISYSCSGSMPLYHTFIC